MLTVVFTLVAWLVVERAETYSVGCPLSKSDLPYPYCDVFTDRCDTDYDCSEDGEELCCSSTCGRLCKSAVYIKRGSCPKYRRFDPSDCKVRTDKCFKDSDCRRNLKCCLTSCGNTCRRPTTKPIVHEAVHCIIGACPFYSPKGIHCPAVHTEPSCTDDSDCLLDEKCCSVPCDEACVKSNEIIVNPGTCPSVDMAYVCGFDITECGQDGDCEGEKKCCDSPCGKTCRLVKPKPGFCPEDFDGSCPLQDECTVDQRCDGDLKCCRSDSDCGKVCVEPETEEPAETYSVGCPLSKSDLPYPYCDVFTDRCDTDYDCSEDGEELCCSSTCGRLCKSAVYIKRGSCPKYRFFDPSKCKVRTDKCFKDSDCRRNLKCCLTSCGNTCRRPTTKPIVHEGACPFFSPEGIDCPDVEEEPSCTDDSDCLLDEKCCYVPCDKACVKSNEIVVNPGTCPSVDTAILCSFSVTECGQDGDCKGEKKCCDSPCGKTCQLVKPKPGFCAEDFDGSCPLRDECTMDQRCYGDLKCCRSDSDCGKVCVEPDNEDCPHDPCNGLQIKCQYGQKRDQDGCLLCQCRLCPYDKPIVTCLVDPCTVTNCSIPNTRCVTDYCGECIAVFYDSSGNVVDCTLRKRK